MKKLSAAHQQAVDAKDAARRENLAYNFVLRAMVLGSRMENGLKRIGTACDGGDTYVWQVAFTPRYRNAVVMETFVSGNYDDESVHCFFLDDAREQFAHRSFDSESLNAKLQELYFRAVQMEREEMIMHAA